MPTLLAVPNVSEGRDKAVIARIGDAFTADKVVLLDTHSDPDHNRTVYTLAGEPSGLTAAIVAGAAAAIRAVDITSQVGAHPRVGTLDVAPIVYLRRADRGAAAAAALTLADRLGAELKLPVLLYGALTQNARSRADIRRGGTEALTTRVQQGDLTPDFGPSALHPTAGAVMVAARPPLIAFNVELAPPADLGTAKRIAALIREGGHEGLTGVRAIAISLANRGGVPQISMNVEDVVTTPLAHVITAITRHAAAARAELVGLAPASAFENFPANLEVANRRTIEDALADSLTAPSASD